MGHRTRFSKPVTFDQAAARQFLEGLLHFNRQGRRAADAGFYGREPVAAHVFRLIDEREHGGHAREERRLVMADLLQYLLEFEDRDDDDLRRDQYGQVHSSVCHS